LDLGRNYNLNFRVCYYPLRHSEIILQPKKKNLKIKAIIADVTAPAVF
jgi:hypothetical protein